MDKYLFVIIGPFSTRSGYGDHARDIFHSLYDLNGKIVNFDIKVIDTRWGDTPRNALDPSNVKDKRILDRIFGGKELKQQPDLLIDVRIPNEFQNFGKFNIGITAGVETTAVSGQWLEGCNKMNLIIVPSEHSKTGFVSTRYDKSESMPDGSKRNLGELKLEKPIEVLFEGVDEDIYKPLTKDEIDTDFFDMINNIVPEKNAFLSIGQWVKGGYGEDRKDLGRTVKVFYETFANHKNKPALILKTSGATFSILDKEEILSKINSVKSQFPDNIKLPNVYLLHGDLSKTELNYLYNHPKVKCFVSFTHGEGFGRPLLEATMTGLPVVASNFSGHLDFLDEDYSILVGGSINEIPSSVVWENILIKESKWITIDERQASDVLIFCNNNFYDIKNRAKSLMNINREKFTHTKMTEKLKDIINSYVNFSKNVPLKLPTLKKVNSNEMPGKVKLPKLKLPKLKLPNMEKA